MNGALLGLWSKSFPFHSEMFTYSGVNALCNYLTSKNVFDLSTMYTKHDLGSVQWLHEEKWEQGSCRTDRLVNSVNLKLQRPLLKYRKLKKAFPFFRAAQKSVIC